MIKNLKKVRKLVKARQLFLPLMPYCEAFNRCIALRFNGDVDGSQSGIEDFYGDLLLLYQK